MQVSIEIIALFQFKRKTGDSVRCESCDLNDIGNFAWRKNIFENIVEVSGT